MSKLIILILLTLLSIDTIHSHSCLNAAGMPVSWWVILKVPPTIGNSGYGYYDSTSKSSQFQFVNNKVDVQGSPLTQTLAFINADQLDRVAWNDEKPNNQTSSSKGHSKGLIAYSKISGKGFFIDHSLPKYPAFLDDGSVNMTIPHAEQVYGQHIACFSLSLFQLDKIAGHLMMVHPYIYEQQVQLKVATQNIYSLAQGSVSSNKGLFEFYQMRPTDYTLEAIFKNNNVNGSIFEDGLVNWLKTDKITAETWGRPLQPAWCSFGQEVNNVKQIALNDQIKWTESQDHSKWAIAGDKFSCFGDMNRMTSQWKRGGAFYCLNDTTLNAAMRKIIISTDVCTPTDVERENRNLKLE